MRLDIKSLQPSHLGVRLKVIQNQQKNLSVGLTFEKCPVDLLFKKREQIVLPFFSIQFIWIKEWLCAARPLIQVVLCNKLRWRA
jgi:hypothetical protein